MHCQKFCSAALAVSSGQLGLASPLKCAAIQRRPYQQPLYRQADFFCGETNVITFPCRSGAIHLVAFFLKLLGT